MVRMERFVSMTPLLSLATARDFDLRIDYGRTEIGGIGVVE
jgi:hypothetical protein